MDQYTELQAKLDQLKTNREKVPIETLKTRYQKPYTQLLESIKAMAQEILSAEAYTGMPILKSDGAEVLARIQRAVDSENQPGGIMRQISTALFKHYSTEEFKRLVGQMKDRIRKEWEPYRDAHMGLYAAQECFEEPYPAPRIYNTLTDEFEVDGRWEKHPEWKTEHRLIIENGACAILARAIREKEEQDGQTGKH